VDCGGINICPHKKIKYFCKDPTCVEKQAEARRIVAERRAGRKAQLLQCHQMTSEYICSICKDTKVLSEFWDPEKGAHMNICNGCATDQLAEEAELEMELCPSGLLDETLPCVQCGNCLPFAAFPTGTQIDEVAVCTSCQEITPGQASVGEGGGY
jgi:NAD-dependent SIR2 family protein deacetylase